MYRRTTTGERHHKSEDFFETLFYLREYSTLEFTSREF